MQGLRAILPIVIGSLLLAAGAAPAGPAGAVVDEAATGTDRAAAAQDRIDALSDDTDALAAEYRATLQQVRALRVYRTQLERLLASQREEIASMQAQIEGVTVVGRQVMPLMERMVDALEQFIALDLPFLPEERGRRVANLRALMTRADVAMSERYRQILEAYQIENEYGRTIEAYRGTLDDERTVDFLRIGRIALFYQTLDGRESGRWSPEADSWKALRGHRAAIRDGIQMAREQVAPDLITVPIPAPEPEPEPAR